MLGFALIGIAGCKNVSSTNPVNDDVATPYIITNNSSYTVTLWAYRYYGIGNLNGILIVLVFFTEKKNRIRLISARQADKDLREEYYDYFKKING